MKREPCNSSTIASVGYDGEARTLEVEFHSGGIYRYFDVPSNVHEALVRAESCGKYLHANVKNKYRFERV